MKTEDVLYDDLGARLGRMKKEISIAEELLIQRDYLQCAVRLQQVASEVNFDNLHLSIMDSMNGNDS